IKLQNRLRTEKPTEVHIGPGFDSRRLHPRPANSLSWRAFSLHIKGSSGITLILKQRVHVRHVTDCREELGRMGANWE
ncbi:hypothetical protein DCC26_02475, partial [Auritidibacter sp. NML120779]